MAPASRHTSRLVAPPLASVRLRLAAAPAARSGREEARRLARMRARDFGVVFGLRVHPGARDADLSPGDARPRRRARAAAAAGVPALAARLRVPRVDGDPPVRLVRHPEPVLLAPVADR